MSDDEVQERGGDGMGNRVGDADAAEAAGGDRVAEDEDADAAAAGGDRVAGNVDAAVAAGGDRVAVDEDGDRGERCLLYTSPSPRDRTRSRMPSSA